MSDHDKYPSQVQDWRSASGSVLGELLLAWFDRCGRALPWRLNKDPYRIWLSEIMLQQTQVQTVIPYYQRFLQAWPTVADLAAAPDDLVLKQWEGLGYYSRARHLLAAARLICEKHGGLVPAEWPALRALPGIGDYTAGAILSIAFGLPVAAVDGNVVRVFARLAAIPWDPSDPAQRREVGRLVDSLLPASRPGDWNEALMDLGATVCLPRQPDCAACPLAGICRAGKTGRTAQFPVRLSRKASPTEDKVVLVLCRGNLVHMNQRPAKGLLAGLWEFDWLDFVTSPSTENGKVAPTASGQESRAARLAREFPGAAIIPLGQRHHAFTHLRWQLDGYLVELKGQDTADRPDTGWASADELAARPVSTALDGYRDQVLAWLGGRI